MATLQLSHEITIPAAIHLFLKSLDVTIPNYESIAQFCALFSSQFRVIAFEGSDGTESHKKDDIEIYYVEEDDQNDEIRRR